MSRCAKAVALFIIVLGIVLVGQACKRSRTQIGGDFRAKAKQAEIFIDKELVSPGHYGGQDSNSSFVKTCYAPGLKAAREALPALEQGQLNVQLIAAYCRPARGGSIFWMMWLQRDDAKRKIVFSDKTGVFATDLIPKSSENESRAASTFLRIEAFSISTEPAGDVKSNSVINRIQADRIFEPKSFYVRVLPLDGDKGAQASCPVFELPPTATRR